MNTALENAKAVNRCDGLQNPSTFNPPQPLAACELLLYIAACLLLPLTAGAQLLSAPNLTGASADQPFFIVERGPHTRTWVRATPYSTPVGTVRYETNSFTELQTGLCYYEVDSQAWMDSSPDFEIAADGSAVVRRCQHRLIVASALASPSGLVDCLMPDGQRIRSSVAGLVLYCHKTGKSLQIGAIKNSPGEQTAPNEITFTDAFDGMLKGSVRIRNEIGQFHQDILLTEKLSSEQLQKLANLGFDDSTRLEVWSEILSAPAPQQTIDATTVANTLDESIDFGGMQLIPGTGFVEGQEGESIPVSKTWAVAPGAGTYLIESVNLPELLPLLEDLPVSTMIMQNTRPQSSRLLASRIPDRPAASQGDGALAIAAYDPAKTRHNPSAVLVDYTAANGTLTNFVCQADATVYVSGLARIVGQLTLAGGTVVKLTNHPSATIIASNIVCQTEPYRMATLTSKDDNSIGQAIPGSTGSPTNYNGGIYLQVPGSSSTQSLSYVRFAYAGKGVLAPPLSGGLWHCQFVKCTTGIGMSATGSQWLRNVLFSSCGTAVNGGGSIIYGEHLTVDGGSFNVYATDTLRITNSIFSGTSLMGTQQLGSCTNYASASGVYQVAGAGGYYLPVGSADIDRGTPNITPELLSSLRAKTTSAPYIYASQMTSGVAIFQPQARREDGMPDRGYYYDPIDYAFGGVYWSNGIVTVTAGTVLAGCAEPPVNGRAAFGVGNGATFNTEGTPTNLVRIVRYNTVQEQSTNTWGGYFGPLLLTSWSTNLPPPQVNCRFTDFSTPAQDVELFRSCQANLQALPMNFKDCQFHGGQLNSDYPTINLTNCLLERVNCMLWQLDSNTPAIQNNLFYGGQLDFLPCTTTNAVIKDNLFDQAIIVDDLCGWGYRGGFNAYVTTTNGRFCPTYSTDIILSNSPNYQVGPLGRFYQPTTSTLINADTNTTAGSVGLYHYTVCTNFSGATQIKETNSWVDIGYHYVALGTNGAPVDTDGGGAPDYLEDSDGDGTVDTGESDYTSGHGSDDWQSARWGILAAEYLRCEYRENPMGVETNYGPPRLYWVVKSGRRAQMQRAYQILVASTQNYLDLNVGDMWNSGKVISDATTHVDYNNDNTGTPFSSGQKLYWKVRSWDRYSDTPSSWSTNAFFQIGLLTTDDWSGAQWIGVNNYSSANPCPMFRSPNILLTNQVANATVYVTAKGVYEMWINGYKIGPNVRSPEWTDYNSRLQYQTYDVTPYLTNGTPYSSNIIGAFVGEGWYGLHYTSGTYPNGYYGTANPQLLMKLVVKYTGQTNILSLVSDSSWKYSLDGAIRSAAIFRGETFDTTKEGSSTNWTLPTFPPQTFTYSVVAVAPGSLPKLCAQPNDPIQINQYIQPIKRWLSSSNAIEVTMVYDMGQNLVGWCNLILTNVAGVSPTVSVTHSELIELDASNNPVINGRIDRYNLASAFPATDTYILNGNTNYALRPHFTYHGFRYVEVKAPPSVATNLSLASVVGCVVGSSVPATGSFWCSDTNTSPFVTNLVSKLMTNAAWSLRGNLQGVFTACTQRHEREGYLSDGGVFSQTACYFVDMGSFLTKWIRDIRDSQLVRKQSQSGGNYGYPAFAPWDGLFESMGLNIGYSDPGIQVGGLLFPFRLYQNYEDARILAEHYSSATNYIAWLTNKCNAASGAWNAAAWNGVNQVKGWGNGNYFQWYGLPYGHPYKWTNNSANQASVSDNTWGTAYCAYSVDMMASMSRSLQLYSQVRKEGSAASKYGSDYSYFTNIAAMVRTAYTNAANGLVQYSGNTIVGVGTSSQGDCMTALCFDMVPPERKADVLQLLISGAYGIANYNINYDSDGYQTIVCTNRLSTGYFLTLRTMLELTRSGYSGKAYEILTEKTFPSLLYPVTVGATTCWEGQSIYLSGLKHPSAPAYAAQDARPYNDRGYYPPTAGSWVPFTSQNHLPFGAVGEWIWKVLAGISVDDAKPGFRNVIFKPEPGGHITNSVATYKSIQGLVACMWTNNLTSQNYRLKVTVPANNTATVFLPTTNNLANLFENALTSNCPATNAPGVFTYYITNQVGFSSGATVFQIGSGTYDFSVANSSF